MADNKCTEWDLADCIFLSLIWIYFGADLALTIYIGATVGFWAGERWFGGK